MFRQRMIRLMRPGEPVLTDPLQAQPTLYTDLDGTHYYDGANAFAGASSQYLAVASNASLQTGDIDFEIGCWIYVTGNQASATGVMGKWAGTGNQRGYVLAITNLRPIFYVSSDGAAGTVASVQSGNLAANQWNFVRAWHDAAGNTLNIQVNNNTPASAAHTAGVFLGTGAFEIGRQNAEANKYLTGRVDGVYLKKGISTSDQATALYNSGAGKIYADLDPTWKTDIVSWWGMNEATGTRYDMHGTNHLTPSASQPTRVVGITAGSFVGRPVYQLYDLSSAARTITQPTLSKQPVLTANGIGTYYAFDFDGIDDAYEIAADLIGAGNVTVMVAMKADSAGGANGGRIISNGQFLMYADTSCRIRTSSSGGGTQTNSGVVLSFGDAAIVTVTRTATGATNIYINGAQAGTPDQASGTPAAGTSTYIGNRAGYDRAFDGMIGRVLIIPRILSTNQRKQVEALVASPYGITLAS